MHQPTWSTAFRTGIAAGLAWWVAWLLALAVPDPFADYRYYAPLGAVVATSSTASRSVGQSIRATLAIVVGATAAALLDRLLPVDSLTIAVTVIVASLLAAWRTLGDMSQWTVTSALFVLVIGGTQDQSDYILAFLGLVVLGAAVGVLVNLVAPPLPLGPSEAALDQLRDVLADQLEALAGGCTATGHRAPTSGRSVVAPSTRRSTARARRSTTRARRSSSTSAPGGTGNGCSGSRTGPSACS
ncbi:aromatic acid exporter family protein [Cellulosimicrobium sp. CUA-896]|uniref:FUSC family protein n=1 Tax=Cellulosimicrobium sp. CUA-896 TaxID=1517881 RepID=UPI0013010662|nr:aromatic acid exporter family protein [Cellulosimicrobium sp. CUA-896]